MRGEKKLAEMVEQYKTEPSKVHDFVARNKIKQSECRHCKELTGTYIGHCCQCGNPKKQPKP
jgi:hypothetical protein